MAGLVTITTRLGNPIEVDDVPEESEFRKRAYLEIYKKRFPDNEPPRFPPTSKYNCFGMLFANRRGFCPNSDITVILKDDGFRPLRHGEREKPGDIVVWGPLKDVEHVGLVLELRGSGISVPVVLSKWGPGPEYIHLINRTPCEEQFKIYTERP